MIEGPIEETWTSPQDAYIDSYDEDVESVNHLTIF